MRKSPEISKIIVGVGCVIVFLFSCYEYCHTGCVQPYVYEPVCGQQALVILAAYSLLALLGIYLIITGIRGKKGNNKEE